MFRMTRTEVIVIALILAMTAFWGGLLIWRHFADGTALAGPSAPDGPAAGGGGTTGQGGGGGPGADSGGPAGVVVHVAGSVAEPGVYHLAAGARVVDAVSAAGGTTADAAEDWLNLAAPVVDGQKVYVPSKKETAASAAGRGASAAGTGAGRSTAGADLGAIQPPMGAGTSAGLGVNGGVDQTGGPVNLNYADQAALETLPGIGPALAGRIIAYRVQHGPFQSIEELRNVSGIGEKKFTELKDLVTAP